MRTFRQVLCAGLSLLAFVSLVVLVFCYFEVFATLYALAIFIGTLVALVLLLMLPIAAYKEMKTRIRTLEDENDELKRQLSKYQP